MQGYCVICTLYSNGQESTHFLSWRIFETDMDVQCLLMTEMPIFMDSHAMLTITMVLMKIETHVNLVYRPTLTVSTVFIRRN